MIAEKLLFTTEPGGEHQCYDISPNDNLPIHNKLFSIEDSDGNVIALTGEELTDLANRWLNYIK